MASTAEGRIAGFDGLRALAFLLVFFSHKSGIAHADPFGDVGVWLFFVLSGFLITRILNTARGAAQSGEISAAGALGRFYLRRTARIFPPYYLILGLAWIASHFVTVNGWWPTAGIAYGLFATNLFIAARNDWVGDFGPFWSLAVEEQFYLLFAPLMLFLPKIRPATLCVALIVLAIGVKAGLEASGAPPTPIDVNSFVNFGLLALGGLIGLNLERPTWAWLTSGWAQAATGLAYLALPIFLGAAEGWMTFAKASGLVAGLLIFQIARGQESFVVRGLEAWPLKAIGRVSYGAYLIHHFIHLDGLGTAAAELGLGARGAHLVQGAGELAVTLMVAGLSWRLLERRCIAWAARRTASRPSPAV